MRGYRGISMVKLDNEKIRWLKWKEDGHKNSDIADGLKITPRRVQQVYHVYKKNNQIPVLKTPGRRRKPITVQEIGLVRQTQKKYHTNAPYLEKIISKR